MDRLNAPSQHPMPDDTPDPAAWRLRVDGMVRHPLSLRLDEIQALGDAEHSGQFTCERGWELGVERWQGTPLAAVLALADPEPGATALYAHAPGFRSLVPLEAVPGAILAYRLNGHQLTKERGAPCRLVVPDRACQLSVKWIERLELFRRGHDQPPGPRKPDPAAQP
jgi:DMSO/TMAO reductase YedYZ molybdopterin-dependent catalytic subunit